MTLFHLPMVGWRRIARFAGSGACLQPRQAFALHADVTRTVACRVIWTMIKDKVRAARRLHGWTVTTHAGS